MAIESVQDRLAQQNEQSNVGGQETAALIES
jgi:hypothetical protein